MEIELPIVKRIRDHIEDENNPHGVVKDDVPGLQYVENYPIATVAVAERGESRVDYLTPLRIKSVFDGHLKRLGWMDASGRPILPKERFQNS